MAFDFSLSKWSKGELVFVISVVLGIFIISRVQLVTGQMKARDAQRKADVELVARALGAYKGDHELYPAASGSGQIALCGFKNNEACVWGQDALEDEEGVTYLKNLPQEPLLESGRIYLYSPSSDREHFRIYVSLEHSQDPGLRDNLTTSCGIDVQCNWYVEY